MICFIIYNAVTWRDELVNSLWTFNIFNTLRIIWLTSIVSFGQIGCLVRAEALHIAIYIGFVFRNKHNSFTVVCDLIKRFPLLWHRSLHDVLHIAWPNKAFLTNCGLVMPYYKEYPHQICPDSKVHGANMGPIWGRKDPGGPHVGPINFAIWMVQVMACCWLRINGYWCVLLKTIYFIFTNISFLISQPHPTGWHLVSKH